ncbi:MAG TPA: helix-turn-helix transcriptional regulator [Vicinamibacterales bacterium]|nr:helix-turn-helix transcriptional regulator [Vicinamibacterales bacterium]
MIELIAANPQRGWTVAELAAHVHLSTGQFRRLFTAEVGKSPIDYLRHDRLARAAHLLRSSHRRVSDIMRAVGISDPSHFARDFKAKFGTSPIEYRRLMTRVSSRTK